jgi:hypothetical protein
MFEKMKKYMSNFGYSYLDCFQFGSHNGYGIRFENNNNKAILAIRTDSLVKNFVVYVGSQVYNEFDKNSPINIGELKEALK